MTAMHPIRLQRSQGLARVGLRSGDGGPGDRLAGGGRPRLAGLHQSGSAKAFVHDAAATGPEVVFLNTSGGLTGGDGLTYEVTLAAGCRATATTQTAERAYRSDSGAARVRVAHSLGAGAHLDWLPQETILFDGCALERDTLIALEPGATCLALEAVILGRAAMGERLARVDLRDRRSILRAGQPVVIEPLRLTNAALTAGAGVLEGARAIASLVLVAPDAADALAPVRAALDEPGVTGAASALDGRLSVRLMAPDGWPLRRQILRLLTILRRAPPPRVWQI